MCMSLNRIRESEEVYLETILRLTRRTFVLRLYAFLRGGGAPAAGDDEY